MSFLPPRWLVRSALTCLCLLVLAAAAVVVAHALVAVMTVTGAAVAALLLTALLEPVVARLHAAGLPDWLASLLVVVATLALVGGVVALLVVRAQGQSGDLQGAIGDGLDRVATLADDLSLPLPTDQLRNTDVKDLADAALSFLPGPATGAGVAARVLSGMALAVFTWFFLLKDGRSMWSWAVGLLPERRAAGVDRGGRITWEVLTAYVRGTTVIAVADAVGIGLAMLVLGVPLTVSLAIVVFLGAYVPIVGAVVAGGLACLVTLVTLGPVQALVLLGCVLLVQQLEGNLLQPLVMGRALRMHPLAVVGVVALGTSVGGVLGALVSVPLAAVAYRLLLELSRQDGDPA